MLNLPTFDELMAQLQAADPVCRAQAAYLLGELGDRRAVEALIAALRDAESEVVYAAIDALGALGDERGVLPLVDVVTANPSQRRGRQSTLLGHVTKGLGRLGALAMEPLVALTRHEAEFVRLNALLALATIDDPAVDDLLLAALDDPAVMVRRRVAGALHGRQSVALIPPLVSLVRDGTPHAQKGAVHALSECDDPRAVEALLACLLSADGALVAAAADSLCTLANERVGTALVELLLTRYDTLPLKWLIKAMGKYHDPRLLPLLRGWADDPDPETRQYAVMALGAMEHPVVVDVLLDKLCDSADGVRAQAAQALASHRDPRTFDPLLALLTDGNSVVRQAAIVELQGFATDPRVIAALGVASQEPSGDMRLVVAITLGTVHDPRALALLLSLLADDWSIVRQRACQSLGELGMMDAVPALLETLQHDAEGIVRAAAAAALGQVGDARAVSALAEALLDYGAGVAREAREALARIGTPDALAILTAWDEWRGR